MESSTLCRGVDSTTSREPPKQELCVDAERGVILGGTRGSGLDKEGDLQQELVLRRSLDLGKGFFGKGGLKGESVLLSERRIILGSLGSKEGTFEGGVTGRIFRPTSLEEEEEQGKAYR